MPSIATQTSQIQIGILPQFLPSFNTIIGVCLFQIPRHTNHIVPSSLCRFQNFSVALTQLLLTRTNFSYLFLEFLFFFLVAFLIVFFFIVVLSFFISSFFFISSSSLYHHWIISKNQHGPSLDGLLRQHFQTKSLLSSITSSWLPFNKYLVSRMQHCLSKYGSKKNIYTYC